MGFRERGALVRLGGVSMVMGAMFPDRACHVSYHASRRAFATGRADVVFAVAGRVKLSLKSTRQVV